LLSVATAALLGDGGADDGAALLLRCASLAGLETAALLATVSTAVAASLGCCAAATCASTRGWSSSTSMLSSTATEVSRWAAAPLPCTALGVVTAALVAAAAASRL
jgi:hypothetical protein